MYSGDSIELFAQRTAKQTNLSASKIIKAYKKHSPYHDAGIMAGYYQIPYKTTPSAITYYMTLKSRYKFKALAEKYTGNYSTSKWQEILTIASIIQKETQASKEMSLISSVIHNRLKKNMKLQLDGTLNYGKYSQQVITPERIRNDKSTYNTYLHKGLPPHPVGSATKEAIVSALQPANTDYLYFMLADNGTHNFSRTYEEHLSNIQWYREQRNKKLNDKNTTNQQLDTIQQDQNKSINNE